VEAITDATPSHDSIGVKQELLGLLDSDDVVLNINGKRLRGDDGDSPRKILTPLSKKSLCFYLLATDVPSNHNLNLPPIPTSTDYPAGFTPMTVFSRASTKPDVPGIVLPASTDENRGEGICSQPPLLPSDARIMLGYSIQF